MEEASGGFPEADCPPNRVGLDESEWFAAERVFEHVTAAVQEAQHALNLAEVRRIQTVLAAWDAMVLDEQAHGRVVRSGGVQEPAFGIHLSALMRLSPRGSRLILHDALSLRSDLPTGWAAFQEGRFSWRAASLLADHAIGLTGDALVEYDRRGTELAEDLAPHLLKTELLRLHEQLHPEVVKDRTEDALRARHVSAEPDADGGAILSGHGSQTDVAAMYDVLRRMAVAAHGRKGETRSVRQLMFDLLADLVLQGAAHPPVEASDPATPIERLGDLRVPGRKAVQATLLVLAPAATATGGERTARHARRLGLALGGGDPPHRRPHHHVDARAGRPDRRRDPRDRLHRAVHPRRPPQAPAGAGSAVPGTGLQPLRSRWRRRPSPWHGRHAASRRAGTGHVGPPFATSTGATPRRSTSRASADPATR